MKTLSSIECDILHALAKRKLRYCLSWCCIGIYYMDCNICGKTISPKDVDEHGLMHLKEQNLLPFI